MQSKAFLRAALAAAALALLIAGAFFGGSVRKADAQSPVLGVQKDLCLGSTCGLTSVPPVVGVYYKITISASSATVVNVKDPLPLGFVVSGVSCTAASGTYSIVSNTLTIPSVTVSSNTVCTVTGAFTLGSSGTTLSNQVTLVDNANVTLATSNTSNATLDLSAPIPGNISITKTSSLNTVNAPGIVMFTIKIRNTSTNPNDPPLQLGNVFTLYDQLRLLPQSVPLNATYVPGSATCTPPSSGQCLALAPATGSVVPGPKLVNSPAFTPFLNWTYPTGSPGLIGPGEIMTFTYQVKFAAVPGVACVIAPNMDGVDNQAHIALNVPGPSGPQAIQDMNPADNTSTTQLHVHTGFTVIDPACGLIVLPGSTDVKALKVRVSPLYMPPNGYPWGIPIKFKVSVTNISNRLIRNVQVLDETVSGLGTPPFWSQNVLPQLPQATCTISPLWALCTPFATQNLAGYSDTKPMYTAKYAGVILPAQTKSFNLRLRYIHPDCDSYPGVTAKPVFNVFIATRWQKRILPFGNTWTQVNGPPTGTAVMVLMRKPPLCPLIVKKTVSVSKIHFGQGFTYIVTYSNPTPQTYTMGTMIDTMRTVSGSTPYATVPVTSAGVCARSGTGVTGFSAPANSWPKILPVNAQIGPATLPQQGVRLIQNTLPVTFGPFTTITCTLNVTVNLPSPTDPYCAMSGRLSNSGILDASNYYNPNFPWPVNPPTQLWSEVQTPLPKCYDVILNKTVSPLWTWSGGGPVTYTLSVSNGPTADPIVGGGPEIVDTISPPLMIPMPIPACTPSGVPVCVSAWAPPPPPPGLAGITRLRIITLPPGKTQTETYSLLNTTAHPYPASGQICNDAVRTMRPPPFGPAVNDYYWKRPSSEHVCVPVLQTGKILVHKIVTVDAGFTAPAITFPIKVACQNGSLVIPSSTVMLGANGSALIQGIPVGSSCTTTEVVPPPTQTLGQRCQLTGWFTPPTITPNPLSPTTSGTMTITVKNRYGCLDKNGTVMLHKTVTSSSPYTAPPYVFPITVACQNPISSQTVNILAGVTIPINGLTAGATCNTTEQLPSPTGDPVCASIGWSPPVITPNPFTAPSSGTMTINVQNHYGCLTTHLDDTVILFRKSVTSMPGYTAPTTATFTVTMQCQNGSNVLPPYTTTVTVGTLAQINNVPIGSTCTTTETLPPPTADPVCASIGWFPPVITPNPLTLTGSGTYGPIAIQNKYGCLTPPTGGTIYFKKSVTVDPGYSAPTVTFPVILVCQNGSYTTTVTAGSTGQINNVPVGSACTTTETVPPPTTLPGACQSIGWFPPVITPNPLTSTTSGGNTIAINNHYGCLTPPNGTGNVVIHKVGVSAPPFIAPVTSFTVTLQCPSMGVQTTTVVGGGVAQFSNIPGGFTCTVAETLPPLISTAGCLHLGWALVSISPNPVVIPTSGTVNVTVMNRFGCQP